MLPYVLLLAVSADDQAFLIQLFNDYQRLMFATAAKYTTNLHDQEEIVQSSLLKMVKNVSRLRQLDRCVLPSFIVILTRNTAINHVKKTAQIIKHTTQPFSEEDDIEFTQTAPAVEELVLLREKHDLLRKIWPSLAESDRILLEGKYLLGYSDKELAQLLGCKPDSVRMKLTRARRKALAKLLEIGGYYDES